MKKTIYIFFELFLLSLCITSCNLLSSFSGNSASKNQQPEITALLLSKQSLNMKVGTLDYVSIKVSPANEQKNCTFAYTYDKEIIECDTSSKFGITIKAMHEGNTALRLSCQGYDATLIIKVEGFAAGEEPKDPYIYSNTSILQTNVGIAEKVFVSLYGGDASDIDGYTWTIDHPSVASIEPTGQYCLISAKTTGYARIKVTHQKAKYPYYIGIYVFGDATEIPFITTGTNILTLAQDKGEQNISVSLVNKKTSSLNSAFQWNLIPNGHEPLPVKLESNDENAVVTPIQEGSATIRITHPDAPYPLDILCRVITIVKNVYIEPDKTVVNLDGDKTQTVKCVLKNIDMSEYSVDEYEFTLTDFSAAEIVSSIAGECTVKGIANGSAKLVVSHPKAKYSREILLTVSGQLHDAIDASHYITTSQNYIRTKVGAPVTQVNVSLKGGEDGDEKNITWTVKHTAKDGSGDVIKLETTDGTVTNARMAVASFAIGKAYITPLKEGEAVITLTHPKVAYPTEILVKVLNEFAVLSEPLTISGNGLVKLLNGSTAEYEVFLSGKNKTDSDDAKTQFKIDDARYSLFQNNLKVTLSAPSLGCGNITAFMNVSHPKAEVNKRVIVMSADTQDALDKMKALYADKQYYTVETGDTVDVHLNGTGFSESDDLNLLKWTTNNPTALQIQKDASDPFICHVQTLKAGTSKVTASYETYSCEFTFNVLPKGSLDLNEKEIYFTTTKNVIILKGANDEAKAETIAVNLPTYEQSNISWTIDNPEIATVAPNGQNAIITATKEGEAVIEVTHPKSQNVLKIYVRVGSEFIPKKTDPVIYIACQDVVAVVKNAEPQKLQATLVNFKGTPENKFSFAIDNPDIAELNASMNGICFVKPLAKGQAEITVTHPATSLSKKVLVVVGNTLEELQAFQYLTTASNVVAVGKGSTQTVSVSVKNAPAPIVDGYLWQTNNPNFVDVKQATGATCILQGNEIGTSVIKVKNAHCSYPLEIIAQCIDPVAASANPYIQLNQSVVNLTVSSNYTDIEAQLVGGKESDLKDFSWTSHDGSILACYGQNNVGKLRAMKEGTTYVTVSHPKSMYEAQLLVICEKKVEKECYISVPQSIINMKPTDSSQTIYAQLINGTATDKYQFNWSLDVYDVVDMQYSAETCTITPKQSGSATITLSHPKAAYEQKIIVNVQEYSTFSFPDTNMTVTQGSVRFITMQVPITKVTTHIEYEVGNDKICSLSGTKQVAQLQALGEGTTTVKAKLIASSSGALQASSEMMVYVKPKPLDQNYITASNTINTVNKDKSITLSATLLGTDILPDDQYALKWSTNDSDIIQIAGLNTDGTIKGKSIYVTALKSGEAIITCSHEKAPSVLQFYIVVPGAKQKEISFNKTYLTLVKGTSGSQLKASIANSESLADYSNIEWKVVNVGTDEICRVMGNGQSVTVFPVKVGNATVIASLPDSPSVAKCTIVVEANKSFTVETNQKTVQPFHSKKVKYTVSPPSATLTWVSSQADDYFSYTDLGCDDDGNGEVEISGIKTGRGSITCVTDGGAKATISVNVAWDYEFAIIGSQVTNMTPNEERRFQFRVSPTDADLRVDSSQAGKIFNYELVNNNDGTGELVIKPITEYKDEMQIDFVAINPNDDYKEFGRKTIKATIKYDAISFVAEKISSDGNYSRYNDGILYIGDGENTQFSIHSNVGNLKIKKVEVVFTDEKQNLMKYNTVGYTVSSWNLNLQSFTDIDDVYEYKINWAKKLNIKENPEVNNNPENWFWNQYRYYHNDKWHAGYTTEIRDASRLINRKTGYILLQYSDTWTNIYEIDKNVLVDDNSKKGAIVRVQEFENNPLYYVDENKFVKTKDFSRKGYGGIENVFNSDIAKKATKSENTKGLVADMVSAEKRAVSNEVPFETTSMGYITITYERFEKEIKTNLMLYHEKRAVSKNYVKQ